MKLQAQNYDIDSSGADLAEEFGMETTDPAVIQIMLENIYPDPYVWPRELLANWMDAGGGGSLTLPEVIEPSWIIEDHGDGMDHEFMMKRYTKIFASNKRDSDTAIGGFGHGRLSPLAYTDTYNVRSRFMHEGEVWEGNYVVFKGENKIPKILNTSLGLSEVKQTGVTVTIPIGTRDIARINERTRFFASYLAQQPEGMEKVKYEYQNAFGGHRGDDGNEMRGVRLILGGVPYPAPRELRLSDAPIDLYFALGELQPTLARDAVNADADTLEKIQTRLGNFAADYTKYLEAILDKEPSVLDRYNKWRKDFANLPYSLRQLLKVKNVGATLSGEEIFTKIKGNFNVHQLTADIDHHRYNGMSSTDAMLKATKGLAIKKLISSGLIRRQGGDEKGREEGLNFEYYVRRRNDSLENIVLFGIKGPYVTGQIKLIKEAIAAHVGKLQDAKTVAKDVTVLLIQYDDEKTGKDLAALISPKLPLNIITDSSARANTNPYISAIVADGTTTRGWGETKALRVSQLDNKHYVFYIRGDKERIDTTRSIFNVLLRLKDGPFKNKTLIGLSPADAKHLPKKHTQARAATIAHFRKEFPYAYDYPLIARLISDINKDRQKQGSAGILVAKSQVASSSYGASASGPRLIDTLAAHKDLQGSKELQEVKAVLDTESSVLLDKLNDIRNTASEISNLIDYSFLKKEMLTGTQPLPTYVPTDMSKVEAYYKKYPLLTMIETDYNLRNYGVKPGLVDALIPYLKN